MLLVGFGEEFCEFFFNYRKKFLHLSFFCVRIGADLLKNISFGDIAQLARATDF